MLENFQNNMGDSQKAEMEAEAKFQDLKAAKEEAIANNKDVLDKKNQDLADTMDLLSNADKDRIALQDSLKEARAFLLEVQTKCTAFQNQFDARVADRADEMKAVAKAIEILTSDEARASFGNTFNKGSSRSNADTTPGAFLQVKAVSTKSKVA